VHKEWLAKHDGLPSSKAEKKEYRELVRKEVRIRTDTGFARVEARARMFVSRGLEPCVAGISVVHAAALSLAPAVLDLS